MKAGFRLVGGDGLRGFKTAGYGNRFLDFGIRRWRSAFVGVGGNDRGYDHFRFHLLGFRV